MHAKSAVTFKSFWHRLTGATMLTVLLMVALPAASVFAASTDLFSPSVATGSKGWVNPTYTFSSDNLYASTAGRSKQLKLSYFNILSIPDGSTINGIEVRVEGYTDGRQAKVEISGDGGASWGTFKQTAMTGTDSIQTLGGATDKWGSTWTPGSFTNANFMARLTSANTNNGVLYINHVQVRVFYTPAGIPLTVTADPQTKHYGYPDPELTYQVIGSLLPGDSFSGHLLRDPGEALGPYPIHQGTLTAGPGYLITYNGNNLLIDQAPLTVTAQSYGKLSADPDVETFALSYTGFVFGEEENILTTAPTCSLPLGTDQTVPGIYPITCSGGVADNYTFTYVDGTLTVKATNNVPTDITLTSSAVDENHLAGYTVGTLGNDDPDPDPFTYTFCGGIDDGSFTIDGATLKTASVFNFEAKSSYGICIQVDDGFHGTAQKNLIITVNDLPETFYSLAGQDGWILESAETSSIGGSLGVNQGVFMLGDNARNRQYRSILAFRTGTLPDNAVITRVILKVRRQSIVGTNPFSTHKALVADVRKGYFGTYKLQLADFKSTASLNGAAVFSKTPLTGGWYRAVLKTTALPQVNKSGVTQFRLRFQLDDNNDLGADYLNFYSGNAVLANQPVLLVQYYIP